MGVSIQGGKLPREGATVQVVNERVRISAPIASSGNDEEYLQPPKGYIYRIRSIECLIAQPSGASTGYHELLLRYVDASRNIGVIYLRSNHTMALEIDYNEITKANLSAIPSDAREQFNIMTNGHIILGYDTYLGVYYANTTDANQTANVDVWFTYEKIRA